jgi:ABC-type multidrug transport system fused ATPase/permease subunit
MAELDGGQILVDGEHISTLSRSLIRKKMIVLTQEPLNFIGPFRLNADPHTENTYVQIMGAIERLGLWRVIHGELDMNLSRLDQS